MTRSFDERIARCSRSLQFNEKQHWQGTKVLTEFWVDFNNHERQMYLNRTLNERKASFGDDFIPMHFFSLNILNPSNMNMQSTMIIAQRWRQFQFPSFNFRIQPQDLHHVTECVFVFVSVQCTRHVISVKCRTIRIHCIVTICNRNNSVVCLVPSSFLALFRFDSHSSNEFFSQTSSQRFKCKYFRTIIQNENFPSASWIFKVHDDDVIVTQWLGIEAFNFEVEIFRITAPTTIIIMIIIEIPSSELMLNATKR